jgi:hypothetical protein
MKYFRLFAACAAALMLAACGGGGDPQQQPEPQPAPAPQVAKIVGSCSGTPKVGVVYVGADSPALNLPNACAYTTPPELFLDAVAQAKKESGQAVLYFIANGNTAPLDYIANHEGSANIISVWLAPAWTGNLRGSISSIYVNGGSCPITNNHFGPTICTAASAFDLKAAIAQLQLELVR